MRPAIARAVELIEEAELKRDANVRDLDAELITVQLAIAFGLVAIQDTIADGFDRVVDAVDAVDPPRIIG